MTDQQFERLIFVLADIAAELNEIKIEAQYIVKAYIEANKLNEWDKSNQEPDDI